MALSRCVCSAFLAIYLLRSAAFLGPPRRASAVTSRASLMKPRVLMASEREEMNIYDILSTIGQTGFVPVEVIRRFAKKTLTSSFTSNISMLFALFATLDVLGSALKRKRLDGTTFKYLNVGVSLSSLIYVFKSVQSGVLLSTKVYGDVIAFILVVASGAISISKLHKHGLPDPKKLKLRGEKGSCPFSSSLYTVALASWSSHTFRALVRGTTSWGTALGLAYSSISTGLIPLVLLVEHQATLARRLNSKTYVDMNWMLLLVGAVGVFTAPYGTFRLSSLPTISLDKFLYLLSIFTTISASLLGLQIGYTQEK